MAETTYEISFDYFIAAPQTQTTYRITIGDDTYGVVNLAWTSGGSALQFDESYTSSQWATADAAILSCIKAQYQPRTAPSFGQWNTAKVALRAHTTRGVFLMTSTGVGDMQWKNLCIRARDTSFCPRA